MGEVALKGYICERCDHRWFPRTFSDRKPFVCPKCKSPYWNIPRKDSNQEHKKTSYGIFPTDIKKSSKKEIFKI